MPEYLARTDSDARGTLWIAIKIVLLSFAGAVLASYATMYLSGRYYAARYPHDGQIGLQVLFNAMIAFPIAFLIIAVISSLWVVRRKLSR
jgi:uncharacterized membrane protein